MMKSQERILDILLRVLARPYHYKRKDLVQRYNASLDTIKRDLEAMKKVGLEVQQDKQHRIFVVPDGNFSELKNLQPLSDADKATLKRALDYMPEKDKLYLSKKVESLFDFQQLGLRALRKPALERIDRLTKAQNQRLRVVLQNYRSRSNNIRDRVVEPFHVDPEKDTVQAYDIEQQDNRHYRLSRIERVLLLDTPWSFTTHHHQKATDIFRIADDNQLNIHLTIDVFAYNSLVEEFPLTRGYLLPSSTPNTYDFQCKVNADFKGLLNFIMANAAHITVHSPEVLKLRIKAEAQQILDKF
ncbi:MAG: WYL domain-containing protein [Bacteroidota bacterium]